MHMAFFIRSPLKYFVFCSSIKKDQKSFINGTLLLTLLYDYTPNP